MCFSLSNVPSSHEESPSLNNRVVSMLERPYRYITGTDNLLTQIDGIQINGKIGKIKPKSLEVLLHLVHQTE